MIGDQGSAPRLPDPQMSAEVRGGYTYAALGALSFGNVGTPGTLKNLARELGVARAEGRKDKSLARLLTEVWQQLGKQSAPNPLALPSQALPAPVRSIHLTPLARPSASSTSHPGPGTALVTPSGVPPGRPKLPALTLPSPSSTPGSSPRSFVSLSPSTPSSASSRSSSPLSSASFHSPLLSQERSPTPILTVRSPFSPASPFAPSSSLSNSSPASSRKRDRSASPTTGLLSDKAILAKAIEQTEARLESLQGGSRGWEGQEKGRWRREKRRSSQQQQYWRQCWPCLQISPQSREQQ